jgi:hypothetical protein
MKDEVLMFSKSLDTDHLLSAIELRKDLLDSNLNVEDIAINTKELYENSFTFPNVSQYDHVQSQLTEI